MEIRGLLILVLITSIISFRMGGECSPIFENHHPKQSAISLDAPEGNEADLPSKLGTDDRMTRLLNHNRFKKGGRAALVDLLDFMNNSKLQKYENISTSTNRDPEPVKSWSWEAMLYDED